MEQSVTILFAINFFILIGMSIWSFLYRRPGPIFCVVVAYFLWMTMVPGVAQVSQGAFYWVPRINPPHEIEGALTVYLIFLTVFWISYTVTNYIHSPKPRDSDCSDYDNRVILVGASLIIISLGVIAIGVLGLKPFVGSRLSASSSASLYGEATAATGLLLTVPRACSGVYFIFLISKRRQLRDYFRKRQVWIIMIFLGAVIVSIIMLWPTAQPRFIVLGLALSCLSSYLHRRRSLLKNIALVGIPVGLFTLVPILGTYNRATEEVSAVSTPFKEEILLHGDYDGLEWAIHTMSFVEERGTVRYRNFVSSLLFFVPRTFAPWKLEPSGVLVSNYAGLKFGNVSCPLPAEAFLANSWTGVLVISFCFGIIIALFDSNFSNRPNFYLLALSCCLMGQMTILLRGSLLGVISFVATQFVFVFIVWLLVRILHLLHHRRCKQ